MLGINLKLNNQNQSSKYPVPLSTLFMPLESNLDLIRGSGSATFTRSTTGTFVDKDDGLVKTAAIDAARFESNGVLIEGASTNLLLRSEDISNAVYTKTNVTASIDSGITDPDGVLGAQKLNIDSVSDPFIQQVVTGVSTDVKHTQQLVIKKGNTNQAQIRFILQGGTLKDESTIVNLDTLTFSASSANISNQRAVNLPNGYVLVFVTVLDTGTNTQINVRVRPHPIVVDNHIFMDRLGLEELPFASSYIPTTTTSVPRTADILSIPAGNIPDPTADYSVSGTFETLGVLATDEQVFFNVAGESFRMVRNNDTTDVVEIFHSSSQITDAPRIGSREKIVNVFDSSDAITGLKLFRDGNLAVEGVPGTVAGTATSIQIGQRSTAEFLFGHIKNFRIYDVALTAEQVARIS